MRKKAAAALDSHKASNLWFGFALGISATAGALYLVGTPKGRKNLKKVIEFAENTNFDDYLEGVMEHFGETVSDVEKKVETFESKVLHEAKESPLHGLIDKIQSFSSDSKGKKTFVKE